MPDYPDHVRIARTLLDQQGQIKDLREERDRRQGRLERIASAHRKEAGCGGLTSGDCDECGAPWPCPTHVWATQDRDPLATWDPADDGDGDGEQP